MFGYPPIVATDTKSGEHRFTAAAIGTSSRCSISHKRQRPSTSSTLRTALCACDSAEVLTFALQPPKGYFARSSSQETVKV